MSCEKTGGKDDNNNKTAKNKGPRSYMGSPLRSAPFRDIAVGEPVFLTKNGRGRYVILDMEDYDKTQAGIKLVAELAKGRKSGEEQGWKTIEEVEAALGIT
jgi:hypothetical protein